MGVWKINLKFVNFVKAILNSFSTFASQIAWRRFGLRRSYGSNCSVNCFKLGFRTWCFQNWLRVLRTSLQKDVIVLILFAFGISRTDANSFTISHSNRWHCKSRSMENPRTYRLIQSLSRTSNNVWLLIWCKILILSLRVVDPSAMAWYFAMSYGCRSNFDTALSLCKFWTDTNVTWDTWCY